MIAAKEAAVPEAMSVGSTMVTAAMAPRALSYSVVARAYVHVKVMEAPGSSVGNCVTRLKPSSM